jgi:metal-responsive CopG/Arc/MetJ family transcriptional regulator
MSYYNQEGKEMGKEKIAITLDEEFIDELDRLVKRHVFQSRSQAIREAVSEKLMRLKRSRLAIECSKLDRAAEKAMAEEGMTEDVSQWPEY